jgi:hypothetical protein
MLLDIQKLPEDTPENQRELHIRFWNIVEEPLRLRTLIQLKEPQFWI